MVLQSLIDHMNLADRLTQEYHPQHVGSYHNSAGTQMVIDTQNTPVRDLRSQRNTSKKLMPREHKMICLSSQSGEKEGAKGFGGK